MGGDEKLKIWCNYKLVNKMNNFIEIKVGMFLKMIYISTSILVNLKRDFGQELN